MSGVNKAIILGHLGRDPELRYLQGGQPVCRLNVATSRKYTNKNNETVEETEWHRVSVWGKQAEHCNNYLAKGRQVYVEGRLRTSSYDKDGQKHYTTEIVADSVQFIGARAEGAAKPPAANRPTPAGRPATVEDLEREFGPPPSDYQGAPGDDHIPF